MVLLIFILSVCCLKRFTHITSMEVLFCVKWKELRSFDQLLDPSTNFFQLTLIFFLTCVKVKSKLALAIIDAIDFYNGEWPKISPKDINCFH